MPYVNPPNVTALMRGDNSLISAAKGINPQANQAAQQTQQIAAAEDQRKVEETMTQEINVNDGVANISDAISRSADVVYTSQGVNVAPAMAEFDKGVTKLVDKQVKDANLDQNQAAMFRKRVDALHSAHRRRMDYHKQAELQKAAISSADAQAASLEGTYVQTGDQAMMGAAWAARENALKMVGNTKEQITLKREQWLRGIQAQVIETKVRSGEFEQAYAAAGVIPANIEFRDIPFVHGMLADGFDPKPTMVEHEGEYYIVPTEKPDWEGEVVPVEATDAIQQGDAIEVKSKEDGKHYLEHYKTGSLLDDRVVGQNRANLQGIIRAEESNHRRAAHEQEVLHNQTTYWASNYVLMKDSPPTYSEILVKANGDEVIAKRVYNHVHSLLDKANPENAAAYSPDDVVALTREADEAVRDFNTGGNNVDQMTFAGIQARLEAAGKANPKYKALVATTLAMVKDTFKNYATGKTDIALTRKSVLHKDLLEVTKGQWNFNVSATVGPQGGLIAEDADVKVSEKFQLLTNYAYQIDEMYNELRKYLGHEPTEDEFQALRGRLKHMMTQGNVLRTIKNANPQPLHVMQDWNDVTHPDYEKRQQQSKTDNARSQLDALMKSVKSVK